VRVYLQNDETPNSIGDIGVQKVQEVNKLGGCRGRRESKKKKVMGGKKEKQREGRKRKRRPVSPTL